MKKYEMFVKIYLEKWLGHCAKAAKFTFNNYNTNC